MVGSLPHPVHAMGTVSEQKTVWYLIFCHCPVVAFSLISYDPFPEDKYSFPVGPSIEDTAYSRCENSDDACQEHNTFWGAKELMSLHLMHVNWGKH